MAIFLLILQELAWFVLVKVFNFARSLSWRLQGFQAHIIESDRNCGKSLQIRRILRRHILDENSSPLEENAFLSVHERFVDPDYALRDDVTLCHVTEDKALFVQTSADVFDPKNGTFIIAAQYRCAEWLLVMPICSFHRLAQTLPDPAKLVVIGNTARCGSTVLGQVFQEGAGCRTWCEPGSVAHMIQLSKTMSPVAHDKLMVSTIRMLCKPPANQDTQPASGHVLKVLPNCLLLMPQIHRLYPQAYLYFMYREILPTIKSINKIAAASPGMMVASNICKFSKTFLNFLLKYLGLSRPEPYPSKLQYDSQLGAIITGAVIKLYTGLLEAGLPVVAVKYDDIMDNPIENSKTIVQHAGLSLNEEKCGNVFRHDSQQESYLSKENVARLKVEVVRPEIHGLLQDTLNHFSTDAVLHNCRLPQTITGDTAAPDHHW